MYNSIKGRHCSPPLVPPTQRSRRGGLYLRMKIEDVSEFPRLDFRRSKNSPVVQHVHITAVLQRVKPATNVGVVRVEDES